MEAFLALFTFGAFFWWVILITFLVLILFLEEKDQGIMALCVTIVYVFILQYLCKTDVFGYISKYPWKTLGNILGYFSIGLFIWAPYKWHRLSKYKNTVCYNKDRRNFINNEIKLAKKQKKNKDQNATRLLDDIQIDKALLSTPMPEVLKENWTNHIRNKYPIQAKNYIPEISRWTIFWVVSSFWFFFHDWFFSHGFIEKIIKRCFVSIQGISNRNFKDFKDFTDLK